MSKHHIVVLDSMVDPPPFDFEYDLTQHKTTSLEELPSRLKDATIVVTSVTKIDRAGIEAAPKLQLVNTNGTGVNHIDQQALRERGISLCHVPAQNTDSVSEHAFALYYAMRRLIVPFHNLVMAGDIWENDRMLYTRYRSMPRINSEETLVIVGYGALGRSYFCLQSSPWRRAPETDHKTQDATSKKLLQLLECVSLLPNAKALRH